jgi:hypothetical protein
LRVIASGAKTVIHHVSLTLVDDGKPMLLPYLLLSAARADEPAPTPSVEVADDGAVVARMHLTATPDEVRAALQDPVACEQLTPEVRSVEATARGNCAVVDVETDGLWTPLHYQALRCPTATGWSTKLLKSDDFSALTTDWTVKQAGTGTDVELRVRSEVGAIPNALVRKGTEQSVKKTLLALLAKVVGS